MKRRQFLQAASVGLAASAVAAPAIAQSSPEVKWRLTASGPKSLDTLYGGCEYFSQDRAVLLLLSRVVGRLRPGHNLINLPKWRELPKSYQSAIITASNDAWVWTLAKYDYVNPPALLRLAATGVQLRAFPQPVLEDCYKAANTIYAELSQTKPHFKKMYDSLVPYRSSAYTWLQVAELGFDTFQIRMRART